MGEDYSVVFMGSGLGGTMTPISLARHIKDRRSADADTTVQKLSAAVAITGKVRHGDVTFPEPGARQL